MGVDRLRRAHVIDWQWFDRETQAAWTALLKRIPAPGMVAIDGSAGAAAAISFCWPTTMVQRCHFHICQTIRRRLSLIPRLEAGQQLLPLTRVLMKVGTVDDAAAWVGDYATWDAYWHQFFTDRTHTHTDTACPKGIGAKVRWRYAQYRLHRARGPFRRQIDREKLFTWLEPALQGPAEPALPRTASPLEGEPNAALMALLRAHRGLSAGHAVIAVAWLLNSLTTHPFDSWTLVTDEYKTPRRVDTWWMRKPSSRHCMTPSSAEKTAQASA